MKNQIITFIQMLCSHLFYCVSFLWLGKGGFVPGGVFDVIAGSLVYAIVGS